jgi:aspartyl-tRNA(Asn)/glutamyl-tRNA(Gln) amidotransferase subunit C
VIKLFSLSETVKRVEGRLCLKSKSSRLEGCIVSKVTKEQVEHVARLARLKLSEEEKESFAEDMGEILGFAEKLNALSAELEQQHLDPTNNILQLENVFREDEVHDSLPAERALQNTAEQEKDQFKVPSVLEE